jgi:hypothetical protein
MLYLRKSICVGVPIMGGDPNNPHNCMSVGGTYNAAFSRYKHKLNIAAQNITTVMMCIEELMTVH